MKKKSEVREWEALWIPWEFEKSNHSGYDVLSVFPRYRIAEGLHSLVASRICEEHNEFLKNHKAPSLWGERRC